MFDLILHAIPVFVLGVVAEALSFKYRPDDDEVGYAVRDSVTSMSMGLGNVIINVGWKLVVLAMFVAAYEVSPWQISMHTPWAWLALFFAEDFCYYWYHRTHHTIRILWASHVVHHSSQHYNLSTALRQTWTPFTGVFYWMPLAFIGFPPWAIVLEQSVSLLYQFFLHTERVRFLPRPIEWFWNTPSHHRVHHGSQRGYLDRNYGGILIIWDRLFRTFEPERDRVVFGLTKNINTFRVTTVAFHEYGAIWRDVRATRSWRNRLGYVFGGPGWQPEGNSA